MSSSIRKPQGWLCVAAFAAAFWITLRVMAATAPPPTGSTERIAGAAASSLGHEVRDPALEEMIGRFASAARASIR